jgi:hypothetical protein
MPANEKLKAIGNIAPAEPAAPQRRKLDLVAEADRASRIRMFFLPMRIRVTFPLRCVRK